MSFKKIIFKKKPIVCLTSYNKFFANIADEFCDLIRAIKKSTRDKTFYIPSNNDDLNNKIVSVVKYLGRCFDETEINLNLPEMDFELRFGVANSAFSVLSSPSA